MYTIKATYTGLVPMMMDRYYELTKGEKPGRKISQKGKDAEVHLKLHCDDKGVFVPADNIRMMLIGNQMRPGAAKILGSYVEKGKGTEYVQMCESSIWVIGPMNPLKCYVQPGRITYDDIDERSFPTMKGKGVSRKIARRPLINLPWSVSFIVQVTDDQIHESKIRELFDLAGLRCGICAYGPTFGRCVVTQWEVEPKPTGSERNRTDAKGAEQNPK